MKTKLKKLQVSAFVAALLAALFSLLYNRAASLLAPAPRPGETAEKPSVWDGRAAAEKQGGAAVVEAGEKKIKTAFIGCSAIYN